MPGAVCACEADVCIAGRVLGASVYWCTSCWSSPRPSIGWVSSALDGGCFGAIGAKFAARVRCFRRERVGRLGKLGPDLRARVMLTVGSRLGAFPPSAYWHHRAVLLAGGVVAVFVALFGRNVWVLAEFRRFACSSR
jgi:hypothetical protein